MKKLIFTVFVIFGVILFSPSAYAATEKIQQFSTDISITKDGVARVSEEIYYDFGSESRHGIYRDIPIDYRDGANNFYITADVSGVTIDNDSVKFKTSTQNGNMRIKIGDADKTVTGTHVYRIGYNLQPVIYNKNGKLFLNLDVYGGGWDVPADVVSASVSLEDGAKLSDVHWYGSKTEVNGGDSLLLDGLPARSPLTINANLPDNYTNNLLEPNKKRPIDIIGFLTTGLLYIGILVVIIGSFAVAGVRWWIARRKRKAQTVIPEYEPPEGMIPAGIGLLEDDTSDSKEFTATIIDWAIRGGLKINRTEKSFLGIKSAEYELVKLQDITDLTSGEKELFDAIFKKGDTVQVKSLSIASEVEKYRKFVKDRLTEKGWYIKDGNVLLRGTLSDDGAKQWAKVDGFRLYLGVTEKDRLKFSDAPDKTPERFNKLLPYAIAFGVEKEWAKQFEGIDVAKSATWYNGNLAAFSAVSLASDLSSGLGSAVASNSSFSSGGGSAGGGVGGGGGGSW